MDEIPKIKPEIFFYAENEQDFNLLCSKLKEMSFDGSVLEITVRKKFINVTIAYRDYALHWYVNEVLNDFVERLPFWDDDGFVEFFLQTGIKMTLCVVIYQYGTYPAMSIDNNILGLLNKFHGDLDFDIY